MPTLPCPNTPYYGGRQVVNPADVQVISGAPNVADVHHNLGDLQVRPSTGQVYCLTNTAGGTATWAALGGGSANVNTIQGTAGGPLTPVGGNIILAGTANQITTAGVGHTITFTLPAAITAPGSLTTTTTLTSGGHFTVTAGGAAITGVTTVNGGTVGLGTDNAANAISIGVGTIARAIHIGDSAAAHIITIGSTTGVAATTIKAGSGGITLTGATGITGNTTITSGNLTIASAAKQLHIKGGAVTDFVGSFTLTNGASGDIANTNIAAADTVLLSRYDLNGSTGVGMPVVTITPATKFVVTSVDSTAVTEVGDQSKFTYVIIRQI
jgi:hypothetical protein